MKTDHPSPQPGAPPVAEDGPRLRRERDGHVTYLPGGDAEPVPECRVVRCFPWSLPDRYVSIRDKDGNEVRLFRSLDEVPEACRDVVVEELGAQDFVPRIDRVRQIDDTFDVLIWIVDTDCGAVEFQVKHDEDIRVLDENRVVIRDHRGMLFEIPNLELLDEHSRGLVEDRLA
jgi:hypothetical protein